MLNQGGITMIILVNGAFGAGKTTTANILVERVENSIVFDPEEVGFMVRKVTEGIRYGEEDTDDFQDIEIWKVLVVNVARELKEKYRKNLIIPMTIYKENNFKYIIEGLEELDRDFYHFYLNGTYSTIQSRLIKRGDEIGGWTFKKIEPCLEAFSSYRFTENIYIDEKNEEEVVEEILKNISKGKS